MLDNFLQIKKSRSEKTNIVLQKNAKIEHMSSKEVLKKIVTRITLKIRNGQLAFLGQIMRNEGLDNSTLRGHLGDIITIGGPEKKKASYLPNVLERRRHIKEENWIIYHLKQ